MASKDIMSEAVEQADLMQKAAFEHAKNTLVEAMSTNLKAAVSEAIEEQLDGDDEVSEEVVSEDTVSEEELTEDELEEEVVEEEEDEDEDMDEGYDMEEEDDDMDETEDMDEMGHMDEEEDDDDDDEVDVNIDIDADDDDDDDDDEEMDEEVLEVVDDEMEEGEDEDVEEIKYESVVKENNRLKKENADMSKVLRFLKKRINEVNLFNSRLAAATDVMNNTTLTKEQKESVVEAFDECKSINEVQRTQKMLSEAYKTTTKKVAKVRAERPNVQSVISENVKDTSNSAYDRLAQLAGL